jgi:hypothetical protein
MIAPTSKGPTIVSSINLTTTLIGAYSKWPEDMKTHENVTSKLNPSLPKENET